MNNDCILLDDLITTLNKIADFVDVDTKDHSRSTRKIASIISQEMELSSEDIENIERGADIHDIGKIAISPVVFRQPSKLTRAQFASVKKHPEFGLEMIQHMELPQIIYDCVLFHHEHYDGSGYHGLRGSEIPQCAQIVCIADVWESLRSNRPYRRAYGVEKALAVMEENHMWFSPDIYKIFLRLAVEGKI